MKEFEKESLAFTPDPPLKPLMVSSEVALPKSSCRQRPEPSERAEQRSCQREASVPTPGPPAGRACAAST